MSRINAVAIAVAMRGAGYSLGQIARQINVSRSQVQRYLASAKTIRAGGEEAARFEELVDEATAGLTSPLASVTIHKTEAAP